MNNQSFNVSILVDQTPHEVFNAINNPWGWWSEEIEGAASKLNDEFSYHYQDIHRCRIRLTEVVPDQKVVWHVLENYFSFTKDEKEWVDTKVIFEISKKGAQTQLKVTHQGLVPAYECYDICEESWTNYVTDSLRNLITTGKGKPNTKERNEFQSTVDSRIPTKG